ncbi:caspase family protein [Falsiroseomonas sp. E2-1-a20]|uniref:caspase family protein n=1 Tax=Falsiroseomonas sp. E2-1-a20 TaxID=3239300 RepID=UPI003F374952
MGRRVLAVLVLAMVLGAVQPALAQRVALVVGNGSYAAAARLENPAHDASGMAAALRRLGFSVDLVTDATRARLEQALGRFGRAAEGADIALLFFAGHGLQLGGENWLVPTDARLADAREVAFELVGLDTVLRQMDRARTRIVILDACRDNPLAVQMRGLGGTRSLGRGLAPVQAQDVGTLIAFSTSPGAVAEDGRTGNSPFTAALLRHIEQPGVDLQITLRRVRSEVRQATAGRQTPWENSSLLEPVVLRAAAPGRPLVQAPPPAEAPAEAPAGMAGVVRPAVPGPVGPSSPRGFRCPSAGAQVRYDDGTALGFRGADPADPLVCLVGVRGGVERRLLNFLTLPSPHEAAFREALAPFWPAATGREARLTVAASDGMWQESWRLLREEAVPVAGRPHAALVFSRAVDGMFTNRHYRVETLWWDLATGIWLRREVRLVRGTTRINPYSAVAVVGGG